MKRNEVAVPVVHVGCPNITAETTKFIYAVFILSLYFFAQRNLNQEEKNDELAVRCDEMPYIMPTISHTNHIPLRNIHIIF